MDIINGFAISLITELAKRVQSFPISPEQVGRIRIFSGALSVISTILVAYLNGRLADASVVQIVYSSAATYLISVLSYHGFIKK